MAGRIVAMTNPTERHAQIVSNVGALLKLTMDRLGCRAYFGGMRVQRSDDLRGLDKPRPDIFVRCGPVTPNTYVTDPLVVVEMLSPSTDRGDKLTFFKRQPTMRHIVLVYQDQMRIEHYRRTDRGWETETLTAPAEPLTLEAVGFEMALTMIYFGVDLIAQ